MRFTPRVGLIATGLATAAVAVPSAQASFRPTYVQNTYTPPVTTTQSIHASGLQKFENSASVQLALLAQRNGRRLAAPAVTVGPRATSTHRQLVLRRPLPRESGASLSSSSGFQFDDAATGAGVMVGLALLGTAGALTARRRVQVRYP